jgi:DNA-binding MarR family transcriptional regulator
LTVKGRKLMRRAIPRHRRDVGTLFAPLAEDELARLRDLLGTLNQRLEEQA